jgi:muramidase (phage lysozyme)
LAAKLGLKDIDPENQDRGAIELIAERGALELVEAGHIAEAIHKCCEEWASFPGGDSGQHENALVTLLAVYRTFGGTEVNET